MRPLAAVVGRGPFFVSSITLIIACTFPTAVEPARWKGRRGSRSNTACMPSFESRRRSQGVATSNLVRRHPHSYRRRSDRGEVHRLKQTPLIGAHHSLVRRARSGRYALRDARRSRRAGTPGRSRRRAAGLLTRWRRRFEIERAPSELLAEEATARDELVALDAVDAIGDLVDLRREHVELFG